jgi:thiol-disulfide isomerase/thioredoxin
MKKVLFLALVLVLAMSFTLFSCKLLEKEPDETPDNTQTENPDNNQNENPDNNQNKDPEDGNDNVVTNEDYRITVATAGNMPMSDILVKIHELNNGVIGDAIDGEKLTDTDGKISLALPNDKSYAVRILAGVPEGYTNINDYYPISAGDNTITLTSSVISDTNLEGVSYKVGDVMRDYTFTTVDGEVMSLSEILESKKAVLLNFWFIGCTWCEIEFPMIDKMQEKYADDIQVLAVNPYEEDTPELTKEFREWMGIDLDFAQIDFALADAFAVEGFPTSILIDRYGVITMIESGVIRALRDIDSVFAHHTADNYEQKLLKTIGDLAPELEGEIVFPEGITEIKDYEYSGYYNATTLVIPDGVTKIGDGAFQFCENLTSVVIPESVTEIGENAFVGCYSLTDVVLPSNLTDISKGMFMVCISLTRIDIPDSVTKIGECAFASCLSLTEVDLPLGLATIDANAFMGCSALRSITIPEGITEIADYAFMGCTLLSDVNLPSTITRIGIGAFALCEALTEIRIPDGVVTIDSQAFCYCPALTTLIIPKSVTTIGDYAFTESPAITDVYYVGTEEEWENITVGMLNESFTGATIHYNYAE